METPRLGNKHSLPIFQQDYFIGLTQNISQTLIYLRPLRLEWFVIP
jgi:hypothetical protein